jgi:hypothetical protein
MFSARHFSGAALLAVVIASPACAAQGPLYRYPAGAARVDERAYERGYNEGLDRGENDARRRRSFDYTRHNDYRDADDGYRGYGDRNAYRRVFRQGFIAGYNEGYRVYAQGPVSSQRPYGYPGRPPVYAGGGRVLSLAAQNGYRDGYQQGRDDRRDGDRFDPVRAERYRSGDREYDRRYGPRDDYKREYRAAFLRGYDDGYRRSN